MAKQIKIVILSPHLDDAVLDVCDHMLLWMAQGHKVMVITVFSAFAGKVLSEDIRKYSGIGKRTAWQYEKIRKSEDVNALQAMRIPWLHLDFVDAGFRSYGRNRTIVYNSFKTIFSRKVSPRDVDTVRRVQKRLEQAAQDSVVVTPLGIGGHVDHLIVRSVAERLWREPARSYYIDYPYGLTIKNWTVSNVLKVVTSKKSILPMSAKKELYMSRYTSQLPLLFPGKRRYSEVVLNPVISP